MQLHSFQNLKGMPVQSIDGQVGKVSDLYFEDKEWVIRYLVVDVGDWIQSRNVLISPIFLADFEWGSDVIPLRLNSEQIRNSPSWDLDKPVSRQFETEYYDYYGRAPYWAGAGIWGHAYFPSDIAEVERHKSSGTVQNLNEAHLRSCRELKGYRIHGEAEGEKRFGHVEDVIFDLDTWAVRYFVIDTVNYFPSRSVLISPDWVSAIDWSRQEIRTRLLRDDIRSAPTFKGDHPPSREEEEALYQYFDESPYWLDVPIKTSGSASYGF